MTWLSPASAKERFDPMDPSLRMILVAGFLLLALFTATLGLVHADTSEDAPMQAAHATRVG